MKPQPIDTAPTDGTVILTDDGFASCYFEFNNLTKKTEKTWLCSYPDGRGFRCADEGSYYCNPTLWTPVPDWIPV